MSHKRNYALIAIAIGIIISLTGRKQFEGILTIGKKQIECSLDLRAPIF